MSCTNRLVVVVNCKSHFSIRISNQTIIVSNVFNHKSIQCNILDKTWYIRQHLVYWIIWFKIWIIRRAALSYRKAFLDSLCLYFLIILFIMEGSFWDYQLIASLCQVSQRNSKLIVFSCYRSKGNVLHTLTLLISDVGISITHYSNMSQSIERKSQEIGIASYYCRCQLVSCLYGLDSSSRFFNLNECEGTGQTALPIWSSNSCFCLIFLVCMIAQSISNARASRYRWIRSLERESTQCFVCIKDITRFELYSRAIQFGNCKLAYFCTCINCHSIDIQHIVISITQGEHSTMV